MKKISKNRKIYLLAGLLTLLLIGGIFFMTMMLTSDNSPKQEAINQTITSTPTPIAVMPTYPQFQPGTVNSVSAPPSNWTTGDNQYYNIKYPPEWKPDIKTVAGGGIGVAFKSPENTHFPRFDIEASPTNSENSIDARINRIKSFTPLNYTQSNVDFMGQKAIQVSEILPIADLRGNQAHKTYIFFNKGDNTYVITYVYFQDENANTNKEKLLQMLNSVKLK